MLYSAHTRTVKIGIFFKYDGSLTTLYTVHLHQTRAPVAQHSHSVHGISTSSAHMSLAYAQPLVYVTCIFVTCICICCHPGRSVLDGCLALPFYLSNIPPCSILLHAPSWCHFYFHVCCTVCLRMLTAEPHTIFSSCISAKLLPRSSPALCAPFYVYLLNRRFLSRCKYYCFHLHCEVRNTTLT